MIENLISISLVMKIILYLSFFAFSYEQAPQCVLGKNCPFNQGICATPNFCKCNEGFETLVDETLLPGQQIYCNYEQISQYIPIVLEIFLPSIGHFVVGNYWLGAVKFILIISFVLSSFSLYDELRVPTLLGYLNEKFEITKILKIEKEGKDEDKEEDNNGEENKLLRGRNTKDAKEISNDEDNYKMAYQAYDEEEETPDNEEELISKDDKKQQKEKSKKKKDKENEKENKFIKLVFYFSGNLGSLVYFMDLFLYKFKIYTDGNGIAFA